MEETALWLICPSRLPCPSQDPLLHKLATEYVDEADLSVRLRTLFEASAAPPAT
jgi:hypothetical protein